jgi:hypothetical protein
MGKLPLPKGYAAPLKTFQGFSRRKICTSGTMDCGQLSVRCPR